MVKAATAAAPVTSAADGAFTVAKVPQTDLTIEVTAEGYTTVTLPVKAGKAAATVVASLRKTARKRLSIASRTASTAMA